MRQIWTSRLLPAGFLLFLLLLEACHWFKGKPDGKEMPLARVYDEYLYPSDLAGVGAGALRPEDSLQAVRSYIDSWIRHKLLLHYARQNLPEAEKQLQQRLRDYFESLLIYQYEHQLLQQKLDTNISEQELRAYYEEHKLSFQLKNPIAQLKYLILDIRQTEDLDSVRYWLRHPSEYHQPKLEGFAEDFALRHEVREDQWYTLDELPSILPTTLFNAEQAAQHRSLVEVTDSSFRYLIRFFDFRNKGMTPPFAFVRDEISLILVNKRKTEFLQQLHRDIIREAALRNDFQVYISDSLAGGP
ncbi:MAG: peptidylprolyl isomerase [Chitinophagales bacterium]|nr:peptidylprolyl isomerase [Chitinophagales bacterium]MDW8427269.1 peptidylprolyl isomerase [Chitinophagales bacterium]